MTSAFVITGFLGSGKTTFIMNTVKEYLNDKRVALIVNEFGEIGVDGKILKNTYSDVVEIEEGCICCKLTREFEISVTKLIKEFSPEVIIVESSGTSEPFPIVFSLKTLGIVVEGIICIVDAKNFYNYKDNTTSLYQIGSSNVIIINKTDLVTEDYLKQLEEDIKVIKDKYKLENMFSKEEKKNLYKIYRSIFGKVSPEIFEGLGSPMDLIRTINVHNHSHTMKSEIIKVPYDISYEDFMNIIENLPDHVIRAKGIIKMKDYPYYLPVHYVFGDVDFGEPINDYKGETFLVAIKTTP